jgi:hypothetical protein
MAIRKDQKNDLPEENRDPITGAKGAHPVGVGVGTAVGGVVTGGVLGAAAGPVGVVAGAVVGGVLGGLAGKKAGEEINPTVEDAYWRQTIAIGRMSRARRLTKNIDPHTSMVGNPVPRISAAGSRKPSLSSKAAGPRRRLNPNWIGTRPSLLSAMLGTASTRQPRKVDCALEWA